MAQTPLGGEPFRWIYSADETSQFETNAPTKPAIENAIASVTPAVIRRTMTEFFGPLAFGGPAPDLVPPADLPDEALGSWVGLPRITRYWTSVAGLYVTRVRAMYEVPQYPWTVAHFDSLSGMINRLTDFAVGATGRPDAINPGTSIPSNWVQNQTNAMYRPAVNGLVSWWASGEASRTRTGVSADAQITTASAEVPDGPDDPALHPGGIIPSGFTVPNMLELLKGVAIAGGVLMGGYLIITVAGAVIPRRRTVIDRYQQPTLGR